MDLRLSGKVFVVTGASAGIGAATVDLLATEGATAVGVSRKPPEHVPAVDGILDDLTDPGAPARIVATVLERYGRMDGVVNNVGGVAARAGFLDVSDEQWLATFDLNFHSAVRMTRAALPAMVDGGGGVVVHVASEAARMPDMSIVDYAAAKTALLSLSKALAVEFGPRGVRSVVVSPGPTRTRLWDGPDGFAEQLADRFGLPVEQAIEHFVREVRGMPSGRLGTAAEVAAVIATVLSPVAAQVTGTEWAIDGGVLRQI